MRARSAAGASAGSGNGKFKAAAMIPPGEHIFLAQIFQENK